MYAIHYQTRDYIGLFTVDYRVADARFVVRDGFQEHGPDFATRAEALTAAKAYEAGGHIPPDDGPSDETWTGSESPENILSADLGDAAAGRF